MGLVKPLYFSNLKSQKPFQSRACRTSSVEGAATTTAMFAEGYFDRPHGDHGVPPRFCDLLESGISIHSMYLFRSYKTVVSCTIPLTTEIGFIGRKWPIMAIGVEASPAKPRNYRKRFRGVIVVCPTPPKVNSIRAVPPLTIEAPDVPLLLACCSHWCSSGL
uniref:Uncharacterized protein n=1 Tax=Cannabis sativa TaxID=3483 RepID=A0A803PUC5_CANSA